MLGYTVLTVVLLLLSSVSPSWITETLHCLTNITPFLTLSPLTPWEKSICRLGADVLSSQIQMRLCAVWCPVPGFIDVLQVRPRCCLWWNFFFSFKTEWDSFLPAPSHTGLGLAAYPMLLVSLKYSCLRFLRTRIVGTAVMTSWFVSSLQISDSQHS